jgi:hypothetical protein
VREIENFHVRKQRIEKVFVLNSILQLNCSKRIKVYALFIDFSKVFDLVHHDLLWGKLYNVGLSKKFLQNLQHIYRCAKAKVRTKFGESGFIHINNGVLQGESVSPKLFTLF